MSQSDSIVFLVDVDNTLLDNDRIQQDVKDYLAENFGPACRDRYWAINERLFHDLGYRDYLGALQEYRVENRREMRLFSAATYLMEYPFAERLYPHALDVLRQFSCRGRRPSFPTATFCFSRGRSNGRASLRPSEATC